jgi:PLD-like domain
MGLRKQAVAPIVRGWANARRPAWSAADVDRVCAKLVALSASVTPHVVDDAPLEEDERQYFLLARARRAIEDWLLRAAGGVRQSLQLGVAVRGADGRPALGLRAATTAELAVIHGISVRSAADIARFVALRPDLSRIEALDAAPGIGEAKLDLLKRHVYIDRPQASLVSRSLMDFCQNATIENYLALLEQSDLELQFGDGTTFRRRPQEGDSVLERLVRLIEFVSSQADLVKSPAQGALASQARRQLLRESVRARYLAALAPASGALLINEDFAHQILDVIGAAKEDLRLAFFVATASRPPTGPGSADIIETLEARAAAGVRVRVVLDRDRPSDPYMSHQINQPIFERLQASGISVRHDAPEKLLHSKFLVADDAAVIVGSHNLTSSSIAHTHELGLRLNGKAVAESFATRFDDLWARLA